MNDSNIDVSYQINRQKIIFTGDVAVGKTSIINTLLGTKFTDEYEPSIGVDFFSKTMYYKGKQIKLQIWDSAGQEKFRSLIPNYIRGASLIFLVYDITNQNSFNHLSDWIKFINNIENSIIIIVGNKIDLEDKRVILFDDGKKFAEENNFEIYEVSAKEGTGLLDMFINSIASLAVFEKLNEEKITKEEIIKCLMKENYEQYEEKKISNAIDDKSLDTDKNKEKSMDNINNNNINNNSTIVNTDLNYPGNNQKKKCC